MLRVKDAGHLLALDLERGTHGNCRCRREAPSTRSRDRLLAHEITCSQKTTPAVTKWSRASPHSQE
jgi:hypothetical protein